MILPTELLEQIIEYVSDPCLAFALGLDMLGHKLTRKYRTESRHRYEEMDKGHIKCLRSIDNAFDHWKDSDFNRACRIMQTKHSVIVNYLLEELPLYGDNERRFFEMIADHACETQNSDLFIKTKKQEWKFNFTFDYFVARTDEMRAFLIKEGYQYMPLFIHRHALSPVEGPLTFTETKKLLRLYVTNDDLEGFLRESKSKEDIMSNMEVAGLAFDYKRQKIFIYMVPLVEEWYIQNLCNHHVKTWINEKVIPFLSLEEKRKFDRLK